MTANSNPDAQIRIIILPAQPYIINSTQFHYAIFGILVYLLLEKVQKIQKIQLVKICTYGTKKYWTDYIGKKYILWTTDLIFMKIYIMEKILTYGKVVMKVQVGKKEIY